MHPPRHRSLREAGVLAVFCVCQAVSQPAIFVSSAAAVEKLKAEKGEEAAMSATVSQSQEVTGHRSGHRVG